MKLEKSVTHTLLGRPCRRNQFLDRISNPHSGVIHKSQFCWKAASGIWLFSNKDCHDGRNWRDGRSQFLLDMCLLWAQQALGPPKARNLLSSALPFNVVGRALLFFWWVWRHLAAHPTSEPTPKPQTTWYSSETHPEPTSNPPYTAWESERNPHGAHREPTGNPAGTCMAEREEPTRSPREPTGNPPGTHPQPYLKQRRSPPPTHWCL